MKGRVIVFGINHRTCPLEVRENYAVSGEDLAHVLKRGHAITGVQGIVVLSTCNRTEFYCLADNKTDFEAMTFFGLVEELRHARLMKPEMAYCMADENALRHLFRVTAGLDSMVLGEPQITGQVKQALAEARRYDVAGPVLGRLFEYAFKVAKDVRTRTGIGKGAVSVGYVAVTLARKIFGNMDKTSLLLIGAGEIAEAAAKSLAEAGAKRCVVTNRTYSRAVEVAERFNWQAEPFERLDELLLNADIAVIAIGAGRYILDHTRVSRIVKQRRYRYLFLVDMGVPRAVEPSVRELDNVFLYDIDDVEGIIHEHIEQRREFATQAESLIEAQIAHGMTIISSQDVHELMSALSTRLDEIRAAELKKALRAMERQPADQVMDAMSRAIVNKLFHPVFAALKQGGDEAVSNLISTLFLQQGRGRKPEKRIKEVKIEDSDSKQDQHAGHGTDANG